METESEAGAAGESDPVASFQRMISMITGYWVTQIVRGVAEFHLAEHLVQGRSTAAEIAAAESTDPDATRRLLRTAASLGLATSPDGSHYQGTPLLATLADVPGSLRAFALSQSAPGHWLPWGHFPEAVRTGARQTKVAYGMDVFDYLAERPAEAALFTQSMRNLSALVVDEVAQVIDTSAVELAIDIGGASGSLIHALMAHNPRLRGAVLDLPHVVPDAVVAAQALGLADRFTTFPGDFLSEVPPADLLLLKFVLHDWDDGDCVRILRNCRGALPAEGGRLVVVELLLGEVGEPGLAPLSDLNMLTVATGRERDPDEYRGLFTAAGLRCSASHHTTTGFVVLEAVPVTED